MYAGLKKKIMSRTFFIFSAVIFISLIFRVIHLSLVEFKADEAINLLLASRPLFGQSFAPGGTVSSVGILNPPLFTYLLFLLTAINRDPKIISLFIAIINSLAIGFLFLLIKRYYGLGAALTATILLAFSPWGIIFSRKIWTQDLIVPFFIPFLYSLHKLIIDKKMVYWIVYFAFSLFLIQLHQGSIFLILPITIFLFFRKIELKVKYILLGLFIGFLPLTPYLNYEIKNNCPDCSALIDTKNKTISERSLISFARPFQIINQGNFHYLIGDDVLTFSNKFPLVYKARFIFYSEYLVLFLGLIIFTIRFKKLRMLAYSTVLLPFFYFLLKIEAFIHYFIIIIPLLFIFLGCAFSYLLNNKNRIIRNTSLLLFILLTAYSIIFNFDLYKLLDNQKGFKGNYGASYYSSQKEVEKSLSSYSKDKNYYQIILSSYIPLEFTYGYMPVSKMIFPKEKTQDRLLFLENALKKDPNNPIMQHELFAWYTQVPPDESTLDILYAKSHNTVKYKNTYKFLYDEVLRHYLGENFKKLYFSKELGFRFYYPEHWRVEEKNGQILLNADNYIISIISIKTKTYFQSINISSGNKKYVTKEIKLLEVNTQETLCTTTANKWCGITYNPLSIGNVPYMVEITNTNNNYLPDLNDKELTNTLNAITKLINSIRI